MAYTQSDSTNSFHTASHNSLAPDLQARPRKGLGLRSRKHVLDCDHCGRTAWMDRLRWRGGGRDRYAYHPRPSIYYVGAVLLDSENKKNLAVRKAIVNAWPYAPSAALQLELAHGLLLGPARRGVGSEGYVVNIVGYGCLRSDVVVGSRYRGLVASLRYSAVLAIGGSAVERIALDFAADLAGGGQIVGENQRRGLNPTSSSSSDPSLSGHPSNASSRPGRAPP